MKNRKYLKGALFVGMLGLISECSYAKNMHVRMLYASQEEINGIQFSFQEENIDGVIHKQWAIDGDTVSQSEYHDEMERAEATVRQKERLMSEQARVREQENKQALVRNGYKKMIQLLLDNTVEWVHKIMHADVAAYCTTTEKAYLEETVELIVARAQRVVSAFDSEFDQQEAQQVIELLEPVPQQLKDLFYQVVNSAIQQCDDTKILKKLLELIGHEK